MSQPNEIESVVPCSGRYSIRADFRLNIWLAVSTAVYLVALYLNKHHPDWPPLGRSLIALTPLLPGVLYIRSWFRFIRGMDELQRRLQLEVFLTASLGTVFLAVVIDTLNANGVSLGLFRDGLSLGTAFMAMLLFWVIGTELRLRRYR